MKLDVGSEDKTVTTGDFSSGVYDPKSTRLVRQILSTVPTQMKTIDTVHIVLSTYPTISASVPSFCPYLSTGKSGPTSVYLMKQSWVSSLLLSGCSVIISCDHPFFPSGPLDAFL